MKKIRFFLEHVILLLVGKIIRFLPRKAVLFLGARAGDFIYFCVPVRKSITLDHLKRAFPEKVEREIQRLARKTYQNLAMNSLEHLCLPGLSKDELLQIVCFDNPEKLDRAYAKGKGVIFVGGHLGNWEYMGSAISAKGYSMSYVVADIANSYINEMVNAHRAGFGINIISKGMSVRATLKTLRNNGGMAMLMDQDAGRSGVFVDFFNRACSTPKGPAQIALKTGAAIVFTAAVRQENGTIRAYFDDVEVDYEKGASEENVYNLTQKCTQMLESYVRKYPDQWFWMHRRWKTTPEMAQSAAKK